MNCVELRESLVEIEDGGSPEQRAHLRNCAECSALLADLNNIASTAVELRGLHEPSARVWNSLEIALRKEGLIRPQHTDHSFFPFGAQWGFARWLMPAAAVLIIAIGIYLRPHPVSRPDVNSSASNMRTAQMPSDAMIAGLNDDDLLEEIAQQSPALKAEYRENLRHVNEYIRDAQNVVAADPNDEEARRSLMEAYQEKAMLFELALDRSLP
ncbi:MAG TPA: hypothetical protein VMB66_05310 [Candidatus Acidoferrales bacterium]|nr:hypothetical protein [Candidatus Acidoferrales bacterium]